MTDAMTLARSKERTMAKGKSENDWLADEIKGDLFPEAEFWSNSRVILNMSCNSARVPSHGWREDAMNETFFGKSWRSLEFLTKCRVFSRCQGIFENKFWPEWNFSTSLPSIDSMERDL